MAGYDESLPCLLPAGSKHIEAPLECIDRETPLL